MINKGTFFIFLIPVCLVSCTPSQQGRIVSEESVLLRSDWTHEEMEKAVANRVLKTTGEASYHHIRLRTAEPSHVHDAHDLVVFVLKGKARMHLGDRTLDIQKGDVIEIPKGKVHWVENLGPDPSEVYAVFTPPFDGKDFRRIQN